MKNESDFSSLFGLGSFEERLNKYDEIEDGNDAFIKNAVKKFAYFISLWYVGRIANKEDFEIFDKNYESSSPYNPIVDNQSSAEEKK